MENTNIQIFNNPNFGEIRVSGSADKPMFCLNDICKALDLTNVTVVKSRLNPKGLSTTKVLTNGGSQSMLFVDEGNLYKCIFQSRKKEAVSFQDWVTDEVLPSIRKTGSYSFSIPRTYAEALRLAADQAEQIEAQSRLIAEQKPKADYFDNLVDRNLLTNFTTFAKQIGIPRKDLIQYLISNHYLFRDRKGRLMPYKEFTNLFQVKDWCSPSASGSQTLLTPRGKETFRLLLQSSAEATHYALA